MSRSNIEVDDPSSLSEGHTINTIILNSSSGPLELLWSAPSTPEDQQDIVNVNIPNSRPPLLFIHGANCAAACYKEFLPLLASKGYNAYALSIRGHGNSWKPSYLSMMFLTTLDHFANDIQCAIDSIREKHNQNPVLAGHSFGGGILQYILCSRNIRAPGLILVAAAPLTGGGKDIMSNWQKIEAPDGYPWPWSPRAQLETPEQVRNVFFTPECPEEVIKKWFKESKPPYESARAGISVLWPFGTAEEVLNSLDGLPSSMRKVLCISAENDVLVTPAMVKANADAYTNVNSVKGVVTEVIIPKSGHHVMLDVSRNVCVEEIAKWLDCN